MKILFLSNDAGGFAEYQEIQEGETVSSFLSSRGINPSDYTVRVNREEVASDRVFQEKDRLSLTPVKVSGAK
jgi:sulfur carrier protein ThiS